MKKQLSVIILHYNRPNQLAALLDLMPPAAEVIVADDGSSEPLPEMLPTVKLYAHVKEGVRAATCRNGGAALATTDYLIFLDDDVMPHPLLFQAHWLALNLYDVSLGLLTVENMQPYTDPRSKFYVDMERRPWRLCLTGNLGITRLAFETVGGFDPQYDGGHGWEDLDLGMRLFRAKMRFVLNPLAIAWHPGEHLAAREPERVNVNYRKFIKQWGDVI